MTVRPNKPTSPKGKDALLMMEGRHTYAAMAKKTRTTIHNIYEHAKRLRGRGYKISVSRETAGVSQESLRVVISATCFAVHSSDIHGIPGPINLHESIAHSRLALIEPQIYFKTPLENSRAHPHIG